MHASVAAFGQAKAAEVTATRTIALSSSCTPTSAAEFCAIDLSLRVAGTQHLDEEMWLTSSDTSTRSR